MLSGGRRREHRKTRRRVGPRSGPADRTVVLTLRAGANGRGRESRWPPWAAMGPSSAAESYPCSGDRSRTWPLASARLPSPTCSRPTRSRNSSGPAARSSTRWNPARAPRRHPPGAQGAGPSGPAARVPPRTGRAARVVARRKAVSDVTVRRLLKQMHTAACPRSTACTCPVEDKGWQYDIRFTWPSRGPLPREEDARPPGLHTEEGARLGDGASEPDPGGGRDRLRRGERQGRDHGPHRGGVRARLRPAQEEPASEGQHRVRTRDRPPEVDSSRCSGSTGSMESTSPPSTC